MAGELRLKGLKRHENFEEQPSGKTSFSSSSQGTNKTKTGHPKTLNPKHKTSIQKSKNEMSTSSATENTMALNSSFDLEELDRKVKSMMTFSENFINKKHGRARICKECGKEGQMFTIMRHIEANHMSGLCIPCNICEKILSTRRALDEHVRKFHRQSVTLDQ